MPIIEVNHLTKEYRLGHITSLKETALNMLRRMTFQPLHERERFKALDDVNFHIQEGEVVGIIGHNGAGKSTLLKHLANISKPTKGEVIVRGSVAPLIEVGAGVNPELTGRENIFLNAAILGIPKKIVKQKLDEIIEFSELEQFIDTPVKRYSSGMTVKLGFSIATSMEADILIVDEVLAVGDLNFQRKCIDRMKDLIYKQSQTVLLVGHNIRQLERICSRMILLDHGKVDMDSDPQSVSKAFFDKSAEAEIEKMKQANNKQWTFESSGAISINSIKLLDSQTGQQKNVFEIGEPIRIRIELVSNQQFENVDMGIAYHTSDLLYVAISPLTASLNEPPTIYTGKNVIECLFTEMKLLPGLFFIQIGLKDSWGNLLWYGDNLASLHVISPQSLNATRLSSITFVQFDAIWNFSKAGS
ncbi:MAG: ABC transporter ATP-binding protein [Marinifilaceae bacterium]|nr:ABC transporter ATP-binding protein [Marinifilaceae bacterium]